LIHGLSLGLKTVFNPFQQLVECLHKPGFHTTVISLLE
jgi:hypothetical protein